TRYTFDDATSDSPGDTYAFATHTKTRRQFLTLVESHVFNPRLLSSVRFGFTRPVDSSDSVSSIEIPRSLYFVADAPQFGQISIPGMASFGPTNYLPSRNGAKTFQFSGDMVAQTEAQGLKFGRDSCLADPIRDTQVQVGPLLKNNPSLRNFSPRVGLAWTPGVSRNTTVRAGFGIYYDELLPYAFDLLKSGLPFFRNATRTNF